MKKMTNLAIVLCIVVVGPTVAQSPKPELSSITSTPRSSFIFDREQFTLNALNEQLDLMLRVENKHAYSLFTKIAYKLVGAMDITFDMRRIILEKSSAFKAALRIDAKEKKKGKDIFRKWQKMADDLESKYWTCTREQYAAAIRYVEIIRETRKTFDELKGYKSELEKCREPGLFSRMRSIWRIANIRLKLRIALPTIRSKISLYEESLNNLIRLKNEVERGEKCLNIENGVPAELLDFRMRALTIVKDAENSIDF